jgi:hypothetical protein
MNLRPENFKANDFFESNIASFLPLKINAIFSKLHEAISERISHIIGFVNFYCL